MSSVIKIIKEELSQKGDFKNDVTDKMDPKMKINAEGEYYYDCSDDDEELYK